MKVLLATLFAISLQLRLSFGTKANTAANYVHVLHTSVLQEFAAEDD